MTVSYRKKFKKYQKKGAYHWKKVKGSPLHLALPLIARYKFALKLLKMNVKTIEELKGIEIGCGEGVFMSYVLKEKGVIDGYDIEEDATSLAQKLLSRFPKDHFQFYSESYTEIPDSSTYNYVIALELIEHLQEPDKFLSKIKKILKKEGIFILSTPKKNKAGRKRDPYHTREYSRKELASLLNKYFNQVEVIGMWPKNLIELWRNPTGFSYLNKIIRTIWRISYYFKLPKSNIFEKKICKGKEIENCELLFAIIKNN